VDGLVPKICEKCKETVRTDTFSNNSEMHVRIICGCGIENIPPRHLKSISMPTAPKEQKKPRVTGYKVQPILLVLSCQVAKCDGEMKHTGDNLSVGGMIQFKHICTKCSTVEMVIDGDFPRIKYVRQ
jgi:hypothetical protein